MRAWVGLLGLTASLVGQTLDSRVAATKPHVVSSGPDELQWQQVTVQAAEDGSQALRTNSWTELATGLTYFDQARQAWVPTVEAFEVSATGEAVALRGPHRLTVQPNLRTWGAVAVETADGQRFQSHLLGLAYTDPASGRSALIAEPKDCVGTITSENCILWQDALLGVQANVRLTYAKAGVEHDVVFLQAPPPPSAFNLPDDCLLEVWHEVVAAPLSDVEAIQLPVTNAPATAANLALQPDQTIRLGSLTMGRGRAFSVSAESESGQLPALQGEGVQVRKSLQTLEGRRFLIEAVDYPAVQSALEILPQAEMPEGEAGSLGGTPVAALSQRVRSCRGFPAAPARAAQTGSIQIAQVSAPERGFVFDYALLNSTANLTLKGDVTYHVSSDAILTGVTTLESAVIKFSEGKQLRISGTLRCLTGPYNPAILTGYDDNAHGQTLPSSTGNPWSKYYAANALFLEDNQSDLRHIRILHAQQGVYYDFDTGSPHFLSHVQFLHCQKAILPHSTTVNVRNALMQDVGTAFFGTSVSYPAVVNVEHLTATNISTFKGASQLTMNVTNSLLVNVATVGTISSGSCVINPNPSTIFEARAAGNYYLPIGSPHVNAGTPNISSALKSDFAQMTTEAPALLPTPVTSPLTLTPQVWRDVDVPDLGWHYPALDQIASNVVVSAAVTLKDGVAVAVTGGYGLRLDAGASLLSEGTVPALNRLVHYQTAQEQPRDWYIGSLLTANGSGQTLVRMRLTEVCGPTGAGYGTLLASSYAFQQVSLLDCQLHRAWLYLCPAQAAGVNPMVGLTNNLFERCQVSLYHSAVAVNTPITSRLLNNLFVGGGLTLAYDQGSSNPTWNVQDNLFDQATQTISGNAQASIARSYNAYTSGTANGLGGTQVITGLNRDFQAGPLGPYYYPASGNSPSLASLADAGSRSAGTASLFHHSVRADQTKDSGTVAIGFHYLAATAAELEIAKSGMTLAASTATTGWEAVKAKDDLVADPGWHNTTYTGTSEYLKVDLGTSRTVSRVGYVPRVMSGNWVDGSHNGVFRKYEVYVTDNSSGTPANWGTPVAVGEWYWPNRQERRDVGFEPKAGRYVYLRRVTAWGWYSAQDPSYAQYGYPGYANANEIWVSGPTTSSLSGLDTDGDGLADYLEDANEDGARGGTETLFNDPDTDDDGLSDGCEMALGTNPNNPMSDGTTPDEQRTELPWIVCGFNESTREVVETGEGLEKVQVLHGAGIPRGTDAVRIQVIVSTREDPFQYSWYNDQLTYSVRIPGLGKWSGSVVLTDLGETSYQMVMDSDWIVCHGLCADLSRYVEFKLTGLNQAWPGSSSKVVARVAAMRVDLTSPRVPMDDRWGFDDQVPGHLVVPMTANIQPPEGRQWVEAQGGLRFAITDIQGSQKDWLPGSPNGAAYFNPTEQQYENTVTFTGLPPSNSAFGTKTVSLFVDGLWGLDEEQEIRVFYPADAFNHPGPTPPAGQGIRPPNYFYYYQQTAAGIPAHAHGPFYKGGSQTGALQPFTFYVAYDTELRAIGQAVFAPGVNEGQSLTFIDLFAWAARHERAHHMNMERFWGSGGYQLNGDQDAGGGAAGDFLPDAQEPYLGSEAGPYNPLTLESHDDDDYTGANSEQRPDRERHNCNSINAEEWDTGSADGEDWAMPGKKW